MAGARRPARPGRLAGARSAPRRTSRRGSPRSATRCARAIRSASTCTPPSCIAPSRSAVSQFSDAAKSGPLPPALRHRLASASGQVAAQRESLARATAALDRAIDVLLPRDSLPLYSALGSAERGMFKSGVISA